MIDLGIQKGTGSNTDDYDSLYLSQLNIEDEITGEIYVGELKSKEIKKKPVQEFYVIITDHENKQKWICGLITSAYFDDNIAKIYGEKGGRIYELIDSLNHALNGTKLNEMESYSVVFETFREKVNKNVESVSVKAVQASNPNAKTPNLQVVKAFVKDNENKSAPETKNPDDFVDDPDTINEIMHICNMIGLDNPSREVIADNVDKIGHYAKNNKEDLDYNEKDLSRVFKQLARFKREAKQ